MSEVWYVLCNVKAHGVCVFACSHHLLCTEARGHSWQPDEGGWDPGYCIKPAPRLRSTRPVSLFALKVALLEQSCKHCTTETQVSGGLPLCTRVDVFFLFVEKASRVVGMLLKIVWHANDKMHLTHSHQIIPHQVSIWNCAPSTSFCPHPSPFLIQVLMRDEHLSRTTGLVSTKGFARLFRASRWALILI